tara:strand:- start:737 stop:3796 length:3060 start_codon:yes stop_codon:yes gene_type:complete
MIEQTLFKNHFVGKDGFVWWIGQVASEESWIANIPQGPDQETKGFGERYKVRIMGYHTAQPALLPDDELPWATVMYPVTAGGGGRGNYENSKIVQGTFVFGFFLDGDDAQQPIIMGCLGYNDYNKMYTALSAQTPFSPVSGFTLKDRQYIGAGLRKNNPAPAEGPGADEGVGAKDQQEDTTTIQTTQSSTTQYSEGDANKTADEAPQLPIPPTSVGDGPPMSAMQKGIRDALKTIQDLQQSLDNVRSSATEFLSIKQQNIQEDIDRALNKVSSFISGIMKTIYNKLMVEILGKFTKGFTAIMNIIPGDVKPLAEDGLAKASEAIACAFKALIKNIFSQMKSFVQDAVDRLVNVTTCFMNRFVGNIFGAVKNMVSGAFTSILNVIEGPFEIIEGVLGIGEDILNAIDSLFSLSFACPPDSANNESIVTEWSILAGVGKQGKTGLDLLSRAKEIGNQVEDFGEQITGTVEGGLNFAKVDFKKGLYNAIDEVVGCGEGFPNYELCGPPSLLFNSKTGKGAAANLVVGLAGELLAVDVADFGYDYKGGVRAFISDNCGKGRGGRVRPILGKVKKSKRVRVRRNKDINKDNDEIIISPLDGGGGPGFPGFPATGDGSGTTPEDGSGLPGFPEPIVIQKTGTSTGEFIGAGGLGGSISKFELYESLNVSPRGFYPKGLGEFSNSIYGGAANLWSTLSQAVQDDVNLIGGSGTGFKAVVRFEALTGAGGKPKNTAYAVIQIVDEGEGYQVGDILSFPDVNGLPISEGGTEFRLKVTEVTPYDDTEETTGIVDAVVTNPGGGYLPRPDDSKGGDGRTWAERDQTIVIRDNDGDPTFEPPKSPGNRVCFKAGDSVILPQGTNVTLEPSGQEIFGGIKTIIEEAGCITTPTPTDTGDGTGGTGTGGAGVDGRDYPEDNEGKYPVVLKLEDLLIEESGSNYNTDDKIIIEPSFGAEAKPNFDKFGRLLSVDVINPGEGFNTMPDVYISSKSGLGAKMLPKFEIDRIGKDREQEFDKFKVIQVIDCVGKFT